MNQTILSLDTGCRQHKQPLCLDINSDRFSGRCHFNRLYRLNLYILYRKDTK